MYDLYPEITQVLSLPSCQGLSSVYFRNKKDGIKVVGRNLLPLMKVPYKDSNLDSLVKSSKISFKIKYDKEILFLMHISIYKNENFYKYSSHLVCETFWYFCFGKVLNGLGVIIEDEFLEEEIMPSRPARKILFDITNS